MNNDTNNTNTNTSNSDINTHTNNGRVGFDTSGVRALSRSAVSAQCQCAMVQEALSDHLT